jgi:hypothetical protein
MRNKNLVVMIKKTGTHFIKTKHQILRKISGRANMPVVIMA